MPAASLTRVLFFSVVLLFPVIDLLLAGLYQFSGSTDVIVIRYYRDGICLLLAGVGFLNRRLPYQLRLAAALYVALLVVYALASVLGGELPLGVIIGSFGTLMIPVSLTFTSFAAVEEARDLRRLMQILLGYAVASALFGMWEVQHTAFWTDTLGFGNYIREVKGITTGFQNDLFLPWNFNGYQGVRRAAGLLAAPLAQGFFLAVVGLAGFAYLRARSVLLAGLVLALCFYGVEMSSTRGAMLAVALASGLYFLYPAPDPKVRVTNLAVVGALALICIPVLAYHFLYTVGMEDYSTIGHVHALEANMATLAEVAVIGGGVGAAGGTASSVGLPIEGGGEGAFFTIAYQLGMPGACVFLWFMLQLFREIFALRRVEGTSGELARVLAFLLLGVATSMFSSEHILTFSGMGAFWFLAGGYLGYARRLRSH